MRKLTMLVSAMASLGIASAQTPERPLTSFPYTPGLDVNAMDKSAEPCVDFYQYTCGGWMEKNPIPSDQARWSVYGKLSQDNQRYLWGILDELASKKNGRNATQQKIGDYFAACMDETAVEQLERLSVGECDRDRHLSAPGYPPARGTGGTILCADSEAFRSADLEIWVADSRLHLP